MKKLAFTYFFLLMLGLAGVVSQAWAQLPLPGSLIVTVTAPASGSTVSGTITVSASVSAVGSLTTAGVRFQLDGANLGAEDTSAPYSISWNTASSGNGTHSLTAIARDSLGNRYFSNPVTVAVSNPSPPPPQSRRYEETDPAVAFSAGWTEDNSSQTWSGGSAAYATAAGEWATFVFTGSSVAWIGARGPQTGIARVSLDGAFLAQVDTYSKTEEIRVAMFTANDLANATHTLTIESTGTSNAASSSTFVIVDAFDVPEQPVSRLQETDPDITYTAGGWVQGDRSRAWTAGAAALSDTLGAQITFSFTGNAVTWIGARGPQTGIARVFLDGNFVADIDTYSPTEKIQAPVYTAAGLADGSHTLAITTLGQKNSASTGIIMVVDGFDVPRRGTRYQETSPAIAYSSGWILDNRDKAYSEGVSAETNTPGSSATFTFHGTGISWIGARGPQTGTARVFLDGAPVADVDTYALTEGPQHTDFTVDGLRPGMHTLTVEATGKNPASTNYWILIDAFDVRP